MMNTGQAPMAHNAVSMWAGSRPDFETCMRTEMPVLYRVARRMVKSEDEAADLVQQTLIQAHRAWKTFEGTTPRNWLIRILRNEFLMKLRKEKRQTIVALEDTEVVDEGTWTNLIWRDQAQRLMVELEKLPEEFKLTITLCDLEQFSYEDAAAAMEVPIGTVRSRLSRGRAMLRARLEGGAS